MKTTKGVAVTVFGWDAKTSQAMDGATKKDYETSCDKVCKKHEF